MKLKAPTEIQIGGHKFKILYDGNYSIKTCDGGVCSRGAGIIQIDTREIAPSSLKLYRLVHEIMHAIVSVFTPSAWQKERINEDAVELISEGITQTLVSLGVELEFPIE